MIKTRKRWTASLLAFVAASVALAACGGSDDGSSSSGGDEPLTIGAVLQTGASPGQQQYLDGLREGAEKYGYEIEVADAQADAAKANDLVQNFVTQGVDAISVQVIDPEALKAGLTAAETAEIPVYMYYAYGEPENVAAVTSLYAGTEQTERMVADMGGEGSVLALTFPIGQPCVYAVEEFDEVMSSYPEINVEKQEVTAPGWVQDGQRATSAWINSHPDGSEPLAVWGCWDGPAVGAQAALQEAGRNDVGIYGQFAEPGGLDGVKNGLFEVTYWFDNKAEGVKTIDLIREQSDLPYDEITPTYIEAPVLEVDKTNIDEFLEEHPEAIESTDA